MFISLWFWGVALTSRRPEVFPIPHASSAPELAGRGAAPPVSDTISSARGAGFQSTLRSIAEGDENLSPHRPAIPRFGPPDHADDDNDSYEGRITQTTDSGMWCGKTKKIISLLL